MTDPKVIVFTGGPCGGKSTVLPMAKQWLENHGYTVGILAETATEIIHGGFSPISPLWFEPIDFQMHLLSYQLTREDNYKRMLHAMQGAKKTVLLCDRGSLDAMAYTGRDDYLKMLWMMAIPFPSLRDRYTAVIHMMSAARGAPDFYTLANNTARSETPEQAIEVDEKIEQAWLGHPHFFMANNQKTFTEKVKQVFSALSRVLHVPEPLEIERKYRVIDYKLPAGDVVVAVEIFQDYLTPTDIEPERRVRKRVLDGAASYFYTSKRQTMEPGVRVENEKQIDLGEYERLLRECDPNTRQIRKTRYCFIYAGKHLELDIFQGLSSPGEQFGLLTLLEVELSDINEQVNLPPGWSVEDVTGRIEYSNAYLAKK